MRKLIADHRVWIWIAAVLAGIPISLITPQLLTASDALPLSSILFGLILVVAWWRHSVHTKGLQLEAQRAGLAKEQEVLSRLRGGFAILKPVEELKPQDLRFQPLYPGEAPNAH